MISSSQLPITISWKWVEGHQAEKGKQMDWWGNQNRLVDALAKTFWNTCQSKHTPNCPRPLLHESCHIALNDLKLSRFHRSHMYAQLYGPRTLEYWKHKTHFSTTQIEVIMWPEACQALSRLPFGLQRFWLKFATGWVYWHRDKIASSELSAP